MCYFVSFLFYCVFRTGQSINQLDKKTPLGSYPPYEQSCTFHNFYLPSEIFQAPVYKSAYQTPSGLPQSAFDFYLRHILLRRDFPFESFRYMLSILNPQKFLRGRKFDNFHHFHSLLVFLFFQSNYTYSSYLFSICTLFYIKFSTNSRANLE